MVLDDTFIDRLSENIGLFGGKHCEVVIHDFENGYDSTITKIVNGHVTGRTAGGSPTNLLFEAFGISRDGTLEDIPLYYSKLPNGSILKSSTTFIRDESGHPIGAVCINLDVTADVKAMPVQEPEDAPLKLRRDEFFAKDVSELLKYYVHLVEERIGKPADQMKRSEKIQALSYLDKLGVFQISKAGVYLCERFHISKFTLYNYLNILRNKNGEEDGTS